MYKSSPIAERGFCSNCGSSLVMKYSNEPDVIWITVGTLDEKEKEAAPVRHIFVESKIDWVKICDNLPQYENSPL